MNAQSNPYAQPLERRWYRLFAAVAVTMAVLVGAALLAERGLGEQRATMKRLLAGFLAPYQELFLAGLPGEDAAEYVVFIDEGTDPAEVRRFFAGQQAVRFDREGVLPGTMVVTLAGDPRAGLELLRGQPFVNLAVRNQGAFFCH